MHTYTQLTLMGKAPLSETLVHFAKGTYTNGNRQPAEQLIASEKTLSYPEIAIGSNILTLYALLLTGVDSHMSK